MKRSRRRVNSNAILTPERQAGQINQNSTFILFGQNKMLVYLERLGTEDVFMKGWNEVIVELFDLLLCLFEASLQTACHALQGLCQLILRVWPQCVCWCAFLQILQVLCDSGGTVPIIPSSCKYFTIKPLNQTSRCETGQTFLLPHDSLRDLIERAYLLSEGLHVLLHCCKLLRTISDPSDGGSETSHGFTHSAEKPWTLFLMRGQGLDREQEWICDTVI